MRHAARTVLVAAALASVSLAVVGTPLASAHGLIGRTDLPIPRWLFAWAAAAVLVISFVALATLWPKPRLEGVRAQAGRRLAAVPGRPAEIACGLVGVLALALVVWAGFAGTQEAPTANLAPTAIFVAFWIGLPVLSLFLGDVFRAFNPWRAVARAVGWALARSGRTWAPCEYPARLGHWPAAAGILIFAWVELVYAQRDDPSQLATMALLYAGVQVAGALVYGVETWTARADAFAVAFSLYGRLAPLHWEDGELRTRPLLGGLPSFTPLPGSVALLAVMIGTTSFDGFTLGSTWGDISPHLADAFGSLGFSSEHALELAGTVGIVAVVLVVAGLYELGVRGMQSIGGTTRAAVLAGRFVHSLVPISLAYVIAHYISLLLFQGQALAYLASDPLGDGSNIFGTADSQVSYFISPDGIWYIQVAALVLGHAAGLVLAHDRALVLYRKARDATRSQYWMLAVMVAFTSLGLWLLSAQGS